MTILTDTRRQFGLVAGLAFVSWLGMMIHNAVELPQLTLLAPEVGIPTLIYIGLVLGRWLLPYKRLWVIALFSWAALHFVGGIITVIPFPFLPFHPEQSLRHYGAHIIYSVAQLPLMWLMWQELRRKV